MPPRARLMFALIMLVPLLIPALALFREFTRRSDIWWTPQAMLVPVDDAGKSVVVYVRGQPLTALLDAGQLRIANGSANETLSRGDVGFRLNNFDRIRAQRFPLMLVYAAAIGALLTILFVTVTGRLVYKPETPAKI